ncbi:MAG: lyase domain protein repeat-containing protein [Myxococcales bacterium]|nr:lyase domain protein repeat-containing protein [Myxococcales bacterium]
MPTLRFPHLTVALVLLIALASAPARAERVDDLCRSLTTDPSWRVRLQAAVVLGKLRDARSVPSLLRALGDENETVRGLSAQVLGDLGDAQAISALQRARKSDSSSFVRDKAQAALAKLHPDTLALARPAPSSSSALHVEVGGIGMKSRTQQTGELTARLREYIIRELSRTPGLTLEGKPLSGFLIDSSITNVSRRQTDQWIEITCEVSFVVGRLPSKAMVMMTSGGATVQAPRMGLRPDREKALQFDALEGAVQGAHQNLLAYLKTQHPM